MSWIQNWRAGSDLLQVLCSSNMPAKGFRNFQERNSPRRAHFTPVVMELSLRDSLASKGLLRHSSVATTTQKHYIKDVPENTLEAMKRPEALCNDCATERGFKPS